jgi:hypothetical protein
MSDEARATKLSIQNTALEHEKARSHLTMVRFPTFHRPEREKARSHLTICSQHLTWLKVDKKSAFLIIFLLT